MNIYLIPIPGLIHKNYLIPSQGSYSSDDLHRKIQIILAFLMLIIKGIYFTVNHSINLCAKFFKLFISQFLYPLIAPSLRTQPIYSYVLGEKISNPQPLNPGLDHSPI